MEQDPKWTLEHVLEVWEPIVSYCNKHGLKAWVKKNNTYMPRLPYRNMKLQWMPTGNDDFSKQQHDFAVKYNKETSEENWNILHPTTQLLALRL